MGRKIKINLRLQKIGSCWTAFLSALLLLLVSSAASAEMNIYLYQLEDRLLPSGDRGYNYFLNDILADAPQEVNLRYSALTRTSKNFARDTASCVFPANEAALNVMAPEIAGHKLINSKSVDVVSAFIYVPEGNEPPRKPQDLKDLRIGHLIGSVAIGLIQDKGAIFHTATTNENLMRMLKSNRIDAIIGYHPDMPIAFDTFGVHNLKYSKDLTLLQLEAMFVCHDTPKIRKFVEYLDERIAVMARDGRTKEYLGQHAEVISHPLTAENYQSN